MSLIDDLVAFWELEEASGTRVDAHGDNDLTATDDPASATGIVGNGADFETADQNRLTLADNPDMSCGDIDFTWAVWIKPESVSATRWVLAKGNSGTASLLEYSINITSANRVRFLVGNGTTFAEEIDSTFGTLSAGTWYFIVVKHDSVNNVIGVSINGGAFETTSYSSGSHNSAGSFVMGDLTTTAFAPFDGVIDQVGFWKRCLTDDEVDQLYNGGSGLSYAGLSGGGGTVIDFAGTPTPTLLSLGVG